MNHEWWEKMEDRAADADARRASVGWRKLGDAYKGIYRSGPMATESAIEKLLADELRPRCDKWGFELIPQYEIGRYRYDFALRHKETQALAALVECDGAAFHSSPEQIERDKIKDILAAKEKLPLFRFTGSTICGDAARCAEDILFRVYRR